MDTGILIPLSCFAMVVLVVALVTFAKIRDREIDVLNTLSRAEADHRTRVAELDRELDRLRRGE
ncbi:MAG TPA: hypothetical protein VMT20_21380 [Terriglobia bacterium]|nr:hypothetical protein [Terriglobia bacterium]